MLVGFDDNQLNDSVAPWLSSVRVPHPEFHPQIWTALEAASHGEAPEAVLVHRPVIPDQNTGKA